MLRAAPFEAREGRASTRDSTPILANAESIARDVLVAFEPRLRAESPSGFIFSSHPSAAAIARSSDPNCGNVARRKAATEFEDLTFKLLPEISPALKSTLPMRGARRASIPRSEPGRSSDGASQVGIGLTCGERRRDDGAYYPLTATAKPTTSSNRQDPVVDYVCS
jgi:hypothetical protein